MMGYNTRTSLEKWCCVSVVGAVGFGVLCWGIAMLGQSGEDTRSVKGTQQLR